MNPFLSHRCLCVVLFLSIFLGCAPVISGELRQQAVKELTLSVVSKRPAAYKGKLIIWGGEVISAINKKEGTWIEILQKPVDIQGRPRDIDYSEGRFLVLSPDYLDVAIYRKGRKVTVAGEIAGQETRLLGETEYLYPVILSRQVYLWPEEKKERLFPIYPYPYYWHYPWGYYPYYPHR